MLESDADTSFLMTWSERILNQGIVALILIYP